MPRAWGTAPVSLALSIGILAVAVRLAFWLWSDRRQREPELSAADTFHFARQDRRRGLVVVILLLLAVGISVGSRIDPKLVGRRTFALIWLSVSVLLLFLLVLAMFDWLATRIYARRHLRALAKERVEILRDELRRRAYRNNGQESHGHEEDDALS
jgi:hypothetical protein